jgi:hypothetical protein
MHNHLCFIGMLVALIPEGSNTTSLDGEIRTPDVLAPNQALYQAELHPVAPYPSDHCHECQ